MRARFTTCSFHLAASITSHVAGCSGAPQSEGVSTSEDLSARSGATTNASRSRRDRRFLRQSNTLAAAGVARATRDQGPVI